MAVNSISKHSKVRGWLVFIYVLFVLLCFYPYEFYSMYFTFIPDNKLIVSVFFLLVTCVFMLISVKGILKPPTSLIGIIVIQIMGFMLVAVAHGNNMFYIIGHVVYILLPVSLLIYIDSTIGLVVFYKKYNIWILIMAVLGTIAFFAVTYLGFKPLYFVFDRADERPIFNYLITFTKSIPDSDTIRYSGYFDEPGAMAYWGLFSLIINRLFIKNQKLETILMIALLFTFSLGYIIQLVVYVLLFRISKKNIAKSILTLLLFFGIFLAINLTKESNSFLYDATIGRIENAIEQGQESNNMLNVDSRAGLLEKSQNAFFENPWFGASDSEDAGGNNIYESLACYGIVGCLFLLCPFWLMFIWGIKHKNFDLLKAAVVIVLGFTHRPFHVNLLSYFIIYSIIIMYTQSRRQKSLNKGTGKIKENRVRFHSI